MPSEARGFTMLYALLLVAAIVGISSTVAALMLRDIKVSGVEQRSLQALYAAQSGAECAYSWSLQRTPFDGSTDIECDGQTISNVGDTFSINGTYCAEVSINTGADPIVITARGYDTCTDTRQQVERTVTLSHAALPPPAEAVPASGYFPPEPDPPTGGGTDPADPPETPATCIINACTGPRSDVQSLSCGLVGHWPLKEGYVDMSNGSAEVRDASGNGRHGNLENSAGTLLSGGGMDFDGSNDRVDLGDIDLTGDFTLAAWIKADHIDNDSDGFLAKDESYIMKVWQGQDITFKIRRNDSSPRYYEQADMHGAAVGRWYHAVGVYNCKTQRNSLYVDGIMRETSAQSSVVRLSNQPTYIGAYSSWKGTSYFDGGISNVRIYRRAFNQQEVTALYNAGR